MAGLVDTNVLVYRFDPRFPDKQRTATDLLRRGLEDGSLFVPHRALLEFVLAVTRSAGREAPLLSLDDARREAEELLTQFDILYPETELVRIAIRGSAAYQLPCSTRTCGRTRNATASPSSSPRTSNTGV